jgi:hypothetical protein
MIITQSEQYKAAQRALNHKASKMIDQIKSQEATMCKDDCCSSGKCEDKEDAMIRDRVSKFADNILSEMDRASRDEHLTVAEIMGVLVMAQHELANKAFEVTA